MNKLLIHANNTSLNTADLFSVAEEYVFETPLDVEEIDLYIHECLVRDTLGQLLQNADLIFIKIALSQNYLELLGLRLAHHIRLTESLEEKRQLPIVLVCEETPLEIVRLSHLGSLLFTPGIYTIKEDIEDASHLIAQYQKGKVAGLKDIKNYLNRTVIDAPASYQSHHSIANEWSILRWARVLQLDEQNEALQKIKKNIEGLLYYKYLTALLPINPEPNKSKFTIAGTARILYIDDEWNKGWDYVLNNFFALSPLLKDAPTVYKGLKGKGSKEIIQLVEHEIASFRPDIILLDLRLCEDDFKESLKAKDLTGYKVLERIKKGSFNEKGDLVKDAINPGIQVIIFTASNKTWNLLELQRCGANGFVLKEAPEQSIDKDYARENIVSLKKQMEQCINRKYLKGLWEETRELKLSLKTKCNNCKISKNFYQATTNWLDLSYLNLDSYLDSKYITSFILYFSILESINNELIDEDSFEIQTDQMVKYQFRSSYAYLQGFDSATLSPSGDLKLEKGKRIPWELKILNSAYFLGILNNDFKKLKQLVDKRNGFIHQNLIHNKSVQINEQDVLALFKLLKQMLINIGPA